MSTPQMKILQLSQLQTGLLPGKPAVGELPTLFAAELERLENVLNI